MPPSPDEVMERLYQKVAKNIDQVVAEAVEKAVSAQCKGKEWGFGDVYLLRRRARYRIDEFVQTPPFDIDRQSIIRSIDN